MNTSSERVLRYLTGNENIDDISLNEFQKLAEESPYFPVAQVFLSKKLKAGNDKGFLQQAQKTALYFSNTYWLHYQLSEFGAYDFPDDEKDLTEDHIEVAKSSETAGLSSHKEEISNSNISPANNPEADTESTKKGQQETNESIEDVSITPQPTFLNSDAGLVTHDAEVRQQEEEMAALIPEPGKDTDVFLDQLDTVVQETIYNKNEEVLQEDTTPAEQQTAADVREEMAGVTHEPDRTTEAFLNNIEPAQEEISNTSVSKTSIPPFTSDIEDQKTEPDEHERMFQNIKAMLDATNEEAEADVDNAVIPIDPYYTIDYFASQGIKLEFEQNPKDELGRHLKKFTQWLKHMKKLGPEDATEVISRTDNEADIQKIAESSNTVREVVTEAMATVLEKQGKNEKAIELYKKLSFLNPHKSAYFADKIKNLKGS